MVLEIDPKKLLYFAAVIEQGSLNRAAKLLCVSTTGLVDIHGSAGGRLGMRLLERGPKGIVATTERRHPLLPRKTDP